jgi:hypothetical protein
MGPKQAKIELRELKCGKPIMQSRLIVLQHRSSSRNAFVWNVLSATCFQKLNGPRRPMQTPGMNWSRDELAS